MLRPSNLTAVAGAAALVIGLTCCHLSRPELGETWQRWRLVLGNVETRRASVRNLLELGRAEPSFSALLRSASEDPNRSVRRAAIIASISVSLRREPCTRQSEAGAREKTDGF